MTASPGSPPPRPRGWVVPAVAGVGNVLAALIVLALGVRYDDRGQTPGTLVWVAVAMLAPSWMVAAIAQHLRESRWARQTAGLQQNLRLGAELAALADRRGVEGAVDDARAALAANGGRRTITGVAEVVEAMIVEEDREADRGRELERGRP